MKKRLVSLVAAAALLGSVSVAAAGTVTTSGGTNITIGGFVQQYFSWSNNQPGGFAYVANPASNGLAARTTFGGSAEFSRFNLGFDNKAEGITGLIEGDFFGSGQNAGNPDMISKGNFRLRHAYFVKSFCQEGCNYTPWLLVGQTWDPTIMLNNYSLNWVLGISGANWGLGATRDPQVAFGVKFDLGSVKLNPQIIAADMYGDYSALNLATREKTPGFAIRVPVTFDTGIGAPASAYAAFEWQPIEVNGINNVNSSNNENLWEGVAGLTLPVSFVNLTGAVNWGRGMTNNQGPIYYNMPSVYVNSNGSTELVHGVGWTAQAQIDFNKLAQAPFTVAFGYGQEIFSNYGEIANGNVAYARRMTTMFANVNYNLTKSATLGVEYDRNKTYFVGAGNDPTSGQNASNVMLVGTYLF